MFHVNAAITAQSTVDIVTTLVSTSPLPIVEATAEERAGQIEKCRHRNRSARRENSRRNHGRDRVGGVVKTVAVFKNDRGDDDRKKGQHSRSRLRILQRHFKDDVSRIPAAVDYLFH